MNAIHIHQDPHSCHARMNELVVCVKVSCYLLLSLLMQNPGCELIGRSAFLPIGPKVPPKDALGPAWTPLATTSTVPWQPSRSMVLYNVLFVSFVLSFFLFSTNRVYHITYGRIEQTLPSIICLFIYICIYCSEDTSLSSIYVPAGTG